MAHAQNHYLADLREVEFVLFEQFNLSEVLAQPPYSGSFDESATKQALKEAYQFACQVLGPLNAVGDVEGCRLENGAVKTPTGFRDAFRKISEAGWRTTSVSPEWGGMGTPTLLTVAVEEFMSGGNAAFNMYPGLALGAAEVIENFGTAAQKELFLRRMYGGIWAGTMCLSEPHAGSDVGSARTKAIRQPDGSYLISGTKIFISCGDQDMTENIVHLVLARTEGAPSGTKGLSLFIVPKIRVSSEGQLLGGNDVSVGSIEHKMGINASATCVLNFGENGACRGELVGGASSENQGIRQMFHLMNAARIAVGIQGLSLASSAYLNALRYARERKQGSSIQQFKDPSAPRVPILEHPDIRRMLLDMKARVEGIRALIAKLAHHLDRAKIAEVSGQGNNAYHQGQVELLTPIVKAYSSDQAFRVCETAIQTLGGAGYIADYGIEQYCRDSKVFSIYEGTNHIQAMDLVGRKLGMAGGAHLQSYLSDVNNFVSANAEHPRYGEAVKQLGRAAEALQGTTMRLLSWFYGGQLAQVPLNANRFLEMMAETTLGWLLLEQAVIAERNGKERPEGHPDHTFYAGKHHAALYFVHNVLPGVEAKAAMLAREDKAALEIPDAAFATI